MAKMGFRKMKREQENRSPGLQDMGNNMQSYENICQKCACNNESVV